MNRHGAVIVLSVAATIWWAVGASQLGRGSQVLYAAGIVVSGIMLILDWRRGSPSAAHEERKRRRRVIRIASTVEGLTILAAVVVLGRLGRRDLMAPVVAVIVGLHFLPIARGLRAPLYYLTATLLVAVGLAGVMVPGLPARILTVGMGAAAVLWLSCGLILLRADREA